MSGKSAAGAIFLNHHKEISFPFFNYSIPGRRFKEKYPAPGAGAERKLKLN
jgi:hypothetical protein